MRRSSLELTFFTAALLREPGLFADEPEVRQHPCLRKDAILHVVSRALLI
jgi:hypothetical protein